MIKKLIVQLIFLVTFLFLSVGLVYAGDNYEILVKVKDDSNSFSSLSTEDNFLSTLTLESSESLDKINVKKITAGSQEELDEILSQLREEGSVLYAEKNIAFHKMQTTNDTNINDDWSLDLIRAKSAWDITTGSEDILIAVIDTGINSSHPELLGRYIQGYDFVNGDTIPQDEVGHGTMVAQIIGANANNSFGSAGITWHSKILPLKVLDENGEGDSSCVSEAIIYAADNNAKVINLSLGSEEMSQTVYDAVQYAYEKGCLIVAAAGNNAGDIIYPAAHREVMAIGAVNKNKVLAGFSNTGETLSMVAPGEGVIVLDENETVNFIQGTSFAAPYVSGAAALIWSINPNLTNDEVQWILESSGEDLGSLGWDDQYGYGLLDIYKAVNENISFFENVDYKVAMDLFINEMSTMSTVEKIVMRSYIAEADNLNPLAGIYELQVDLPEIDQMASYKLTNKVIVLGLAATREEALVLMNKSLEQFIDWSMTDRILLMDYMDANNTQGVSELLAKNKSYNPNIDTNNALEEAVDITGNSGSSFFGITRDKDFYSFTLSESANYVINATHSEKLNVHIDLYNKSTGEFIKGGAEYVLLNNLSMGEYYVVLEEENGKWSQEDYEVKLIGQGQGVYDFNQDNIVDIFDMIKIAKLIGIDSYSNQYNWMYDLNLDAVIDIIDLQIISQQYGVRR